MGKSKVIKALLEQWKEMRRSMHLSKATDIERLLRTFDLLRVSVVTKDAPEGSDGSILAAGRRIYFNEKGEITRVTDNDYYNAKGGKKDG